MLTDFLTFIMKNLTDFCKMVEIGMDPRLGPSISAPLTIQNIKIFLGKLLNFNPLVNDNLS